MLRMGVEPCLQVYVVESVMMLTRCLLRLKKKTRVQGWDAEARLQVVGTAGAIIDG